MLNGKRLSGPPKTGLDLVHDQQRAALFADLTGCLDVFQAGRINSTLSLNYLQNDRGGLGGHGLFQGFDMRGQVIPGLYAGGEAVGGFQKHGLGKGHVHGFIAGTNAAAEPTTPSG
jgi:hypothetical protein